MTRGAVKEILLLYRPGTADAEDPQVAEAIEFAKRDPELGRWFEQHQVFQAAMRAKFRQIEGGNALSWLCSHAKRYCLLRRPFGRDRSGWQLGGAGGLRLRNSYRSAQAGRSRSFWQCQGHIIVRKQQQ